MSAANPRPSGPPALVLASSSSARLRVLRAAGFDPRVVPSGADETVGDLPTEHAVAVLARRKAALVAEACPDALVLGCDSMLDLHGTALGKPVSATHAVRMWQDLSGQEATLYTGHCLIDTASKEEPCEVAATVVRFGRPSDEEITAYVATGEPMQMAGAFGLEGRSGPFVEGIDGDPSNVLGLSLPLLRRMLARFGWSVTNFWPGDDQSGEA